MALQAALVAWLRADSVVAALVGERVFDEVPADGRLPQDAAYLRVESIESRRDPSGDGRCRPLLHAITLRLVAATPDFGAKRCWTLAAAARAALDFAEPPLPAPYALQTPLEVVRLADVRSPIAPKIVLLTVQTAVNEF